MIYNFDVDVAMKVGVNGAIVLSNFKFWIAKNIANNDNFYDGEYWTYNSIPAFKKLFPFWTERQIRTILDKLKDDGYINTGNYNKMAYDRTTWYSFTEKGKALMSIQYVNTHVTNMSDGVDKNDKSNLQKGQMSFDKNVAPIPDKKPDEKPNKKLTYMDLTFIEDYIDTVKITQDQYDKLVKDYGVNIVNNTIRNLDNYIVNNKRKYKDHNRVLRTWLSKNNNQNGKGIEKKNNSSSLNANSNYNYDINSLIEKMKSEV